MGDRSDKSRRYLIACGTSNYKNLSENQQLPSVQTDLERVVKLFTQNFGYEEVLSNFQLNPNATELIKQFADWLKGEERCETDIVIFYYSGHGEDVQGDRHYLLMEDTDPSKIGQTALPTEDLVRPLKNEGVKIEQILYIIDTCYSQSGAGDVTNFASKVIQQFQPVKGANIPVHSIAACRAKQTAQEGIFSKKLEEILNNREIEFQGRYINPSELVEKINQKITFKTQHVIHNNVGSESSAKFFPILPKTLYAWEKKYHKLIEELASILNQKLDESLFFVNSFILSNKFIEEFVLDELGLKEKLRELAIKPVSDEICLLISCSEWCRLRFCERRNDDNLTLANKIENWQAEVIKYREGVKLEKIKEFVKDSFNKFKELIKKGDLRIQIEIEPRMDEERNTGLATGTFLLNMNLWIESQDLPLGRFAENVVLQPLGSDRSNSEQNSGSLQICLEEEDLLSNLIRKARYSLPESVKLEIEIFLPLDFFQESLEKICFQSGRKKNLWEKSIQSLLTHLSVISIKTFVRFVMHLKAKRKTYGVMILTCTLSITTSARNHPSQTWK